MRQVNGVRPEAEAETEPIADIRALFDMYQIGVAWHCVCAISRLRVPDRLVGGARPMPLLAAEVGADEDALRRVLRLLSSHGIVAFDPVADEVSLTGRGRLLCASHPMSLQATFATLGISDVAHALTETLVTGHAAAPHVLGTGFWEYLASQPDKQTAFGEAMVEQAQLLSLPCLPLLDWPAGGVVVDVAGGIGVLTAGVLVEEPELAVVLVDQPHVLTLAVPYLESQGVIDRCTLHPGDLFVPPPPGDLYLLARVLHDWDDASAVRILRAVANGAPPGARLRLFEDLLPEHGVPSPQQNWSDVAMMVLYEGAKERTLTEYQRLLERGGWLFERVVTGPPGMSVIEASRGRTPAGPDTGEVEP
ncbi:methyltransferase [Streptosporangium sp. NPDC051023]|uniref:methyltransferase n=1 Tax=Streptosporangium sp. NPDC051023 TaxID=3155410 RepID=UPI00344C6AD9